MIVVAIIALLAAIAVPGFLRARKRSQASKILNDLRMIDSAIDQYAIENGKKTGDPVGVTDWTNYVKKDSTLFVTGQDSVRQRLRHPKRRYPAEGVASGLEYVVGRCRFGVLVALRALLGSFTPQ